jgi:Tfp pilus assembly protein PilF
MKKLFWIVCCACLIPLTSLYANAPRQAPQFWEESIQQAFASRDSYYKINDIDRLPSHFENLLTESGRSTLAKKLALRPDTLSPWFHFLSGLYTASSSTSAAIAHFSHAVALASQEPGTSWVLFIEFRQAGQYQWAEKCLTQLERQFLLSGAQSVPIVSHQLLHLAGLDPSSSIDYLQWSKRFDLHGTGQLAARFSPLLLFKPAQLFSLASEGFGMLGESWFLQMRFLDFFYRWLRFALIAGILALFLSFLLRALPTALHPLSELYPSTLTPRLRLTLSVILFVSTIVFGLLPFLLLAGILIWPYLDKPRNVLLALCLAGIVLSPLDAYLLDVFRVSLAADNGIGLLHRAVDEGYSVRTENDIVDFLNKNPQNPTAHLAAAMMSLKQKNYDEAAIRIGAAQKLQPEDPVIILTAGNIEFARGAYDKATALYTSCINLFPEYEMAYFNLGQVYLMTMRMVDGADLIGRATRLNGRSVNAFIAKNDAHFGNSWPVHFLPPDYKPLYFWKNIFRANAAGGQQGWATWSASFFGLPPLVFLILAPLLLIVILPIQSKKASGSRVKKIFYCKLCGIPLCKKCKTGQFCIECLQSAHRINQESAADQNAENRILRRRYLTGVYLKMVLDCLFPGAGLLFRRSEKLLLPFVLICLSALTYATYYALITFCFAYPFWIVKGWFVTATILCLLYSLLGIGRALYVFSHEIRTKERIGVA